MALVSLLVGSAADLGVLLLISQVFSGFGAGSVLPVIYVYIDKIMSKKWSNRAVLIANGVGYRLVYLDLSPT